MSYDRARVCNRCKLATPVKSDYDRPANWHTVTRDRHDTVGAAELDLCPKCDKEFTDAFLHMLSTVVE